MHPKPQPRQAMIAVIRYVEEIDLVGPDAKAGINMKADFTEKPLLSSMFVKAQCEPSVRLRRFNLFQFKPNTDGEWSATGHKVAVSDIDPITPPVQPDIYF
jgi:hypothetical protein